MFVPKINSAIFAGLNRSAATAAEATTRLASGTKLIKDAPADLMQSFKADTHAQSLNQANRNIQDGMSLTQFASDTLGEMRRGVTEIKTMLIQLGNGTLTNADKANIGSQIRERATEVYRLMRETEFNGQAIFATDKNPERNIRIQTGANAGDTLNLNFQSLVPELDDNIWAADGVNVEFNFDVNDPQGSLAHLGAFMDKVESNINREDSKLAAAQRTLESRLRMNTVEATSNEERAQRLSGVDIAKEMSKLTAANLQRDIGVSLLAQINGNNDRFIRLLLAS